MTTTKCDYCPEPAIQGDPDNACTACRTDITAVEAADALETVRSEAARGLADTYTSQRPHGLLRTTHLTPAEHDLLCALVAHYLLSLQRIRRDSAHPNDRLLAADISLAERALEALEAAR